MRARLQKLQHKNVIVYPVQRNPVRFYMAVPALPACKVMVAVPCLKRLAIRDLPHNTVKFLRILAAFPAFLKLPEEAFFPAQRVA